MPEKFYIIVEDPEMVNVCFWYVPERLREVEHGPERMQELGKVTAELKSRMMYAGNLMVGYQPLDDKPNFFRSISPDSGHKIFDPNSDTRAEKH